VTNVSKTARRVLQWLWAGLLAWSGVLWWVKRKLRNDGAVVALTFHRVLRDAEYCRTHSLPGIVVRENTFRQLIGYIARRYQTVDLPEAEPGKRLDKLAIALTFDDGWSDNYSVAFPILDAFKLPCTIFVCPGLTGTNNSFWPERVVGLLRAARPAIGDPEIESIIERLKRSSTEERQQYLAEISALAPSDRPLTSIPRSDGTLSWPEITEMARAGVRFGAHTHTHQILPMTPLDSVRQEVRQSKAAIEHMLQEPCDVFAYPNGDWSHETRRIVGEHGFRLAFTDKRGAWTPACDPLAIPRSNTYEGNLIGPTGRFSPAMFEYTTFWKVWIAMKVKTIFSPQPQRRSTPVTA
jgi:peptidoglycan/xylan/chitin deacetylase (PgdA/CDA1 family)